MSIDPEVATTGQPYVFTNDNPLNQEDPLGDGSLGGLLGKATCILVITANCFGQLGNDFSQNLSKSEQEAIQAIVSGDTEDMAPTVKKALGEVEEATEKAGKDVGEGTKDAAKALLKADLKLSAKVDNILSGILHPKSGPVIKLGPVKIPLFDFDFGISF